VELAATRGSTLRSSAVPSFQTTRRLTPVQHQPPKADTTEPHRRLRPQIKWPVEKARARIKRVSHLVPERPNCLRGASPSPGARQISVAVQSWRRPYWAARRL